MAQSLSGRSLTGFVRESRILPVGTRSRGFVQTRAADSKRAHWLPGTEFPKHLDGSLPGDFGFDPLRLGDKKESLEWYQQAELQNGRWAMLGVFGILFHNLLGKAGLGGPAATTTTWFDAGKFNYGVDNRTLLAIEFFLFAWVEARRYQDLKKPRSANVDPVFSNNKLPEQNEPGYPGGIFDPLNFTKGSNLEELKLKEIKNGRLAMLAFAGFVAQAWTTRESPLDNLFSHLSDPWAQNVFGRDLARLRDNSSLELTTTVIERRVIKSAFIYTSLRAYD